MFNSKAKGFIFLCGVIELTIEMDTIGKRLDSIRKREGLSQSAFCAELNISRTSLQNYVKDEREIPASILAFLLEKWSIDPVWMMEGDSSNTAMKRKADVLRQIKDIGMALENRAALIGLELNAEERWRLVSQIYTIAIIQTGAFDTEKATSDFFIDSVFTNNGFS